MYIIHSERMQFFRMRINMNRINRDSEKAEIPDRPKKTFRLIIVFFILFLMAMLLWRLFFYKSVDEQLKEIQAAYAIPNSENAAVYYRIFFSEPNNLNAIENISFY